MYLCDSFTEIMALQTFVQYHYYRFYRIFDHNNTIIRLLGESLYHHLVKLAISIYVQSLQCKILKPIFCHNFPVVKDFFLEYPDQKVLL